MKPQSLFSEIERRGTVNSGLSVGQPLLTLTRRVEEFGGGRGVGVLC